jgi:hypothetical protein
VLGADGIEQSVIKFGFANDFITNELQSSSALKKIRVVDCVTVPWLTVEDKVL